MLHKKENTVRQALQSLYDQLVPVLSRCLEREQIHIAKEEVIRCLTPEAIDDIFAEFQVLQFQTLQ